MMPAVEEQGGEAQKCTMTMGSSVQSRKEELEALGTEEGM